MRSVQGCGMICFEQTSAILMSIVRAQCVKARMRKIAAQMCRLSLVLRIAPDLAATVRLFTFAFTVDQWSRHCLP